jgi:ERCC4-type nuclease
MKKISQQEKLKFYEERRKADRKKMKDIKKKLSNELHEEEYKTYKKLYDVMKEFLNIREISYDRLKTINNDELYSIIFDEKNNSTVDNDTPSAQAF